MLQGARRIVFKDFEKALAAIAAEKNASLEAIQAQIVSSGGPKRTGTTQAGHVRLHDDKSNYTGASLAISCDTPLHVRLAISSSPGCDCPSKLDRWSTCSQ